MEADVRGGCAVKRVEFERGVVLVSWLLSEKYVMFSVVTAGVGPGR